MTDITYIIVGLIIIIFGVATKLIWPNIRAKLTSEQLSALKVVVEIAVYSAEKVFGPKMGADKKAYAINLAKRLLEKKNLTFDEEVVDAAIEAQVQQLDLDKKAVEGA